MQVTCTGAAQYGTIIYYSHLVPILLTTALVIFTYFRSKNVLLKQLFFAFSLFFCLWLIGDMIAWSATDDYYDLISAVWAPLDYINIVFYLLSAYFFVVMVQGRDIALWQKLVLIAMAFPAWWLTITNQSIVAFYQPYCEAWNNEWLSQYKLAIEVLVVGFIMFYAFFAGRKSNSVKRWQIATVCLGLVLFFSVFSVTEYIASQTGAYEINLYSLFVLPLFLFIITYAITNLGILRTKKVGFRLLAYVLIVMVGSQFFFLQNTTDRALSALTFILSLGFGVLLIRSGKREEEAREKAEHLTGELKKANDELKEMDRRKDELLSLVSHQLATPISSIKWYLEMMKDGDLGKLTPEQKEHVLTIYGISNSLSDLVSMILDVSRIQLGRINIEKQELDLQEFFQEILAVIEPKATEKKQKFTVHIPDKLPIATLDRRYTRMTIENLLTNAIKYTPDKGTVTLKVSIKDGVMTCTVSDSGCGIPEKDQDKIFGRMYRASNVSNSVDGNGFGLFIAKGAVEAQGGKISFVSKEGKGTTFTVVLPLQGA